MDFKQIETKWQSKWNYKSTDYNKPKKYIVNMFPYPSGKIHMGHIRNYTIGDCIARYYRNNGYNVMQPMGWDSFGMPAEAAAIKNNTHPKEWTYNNIADMKTQLQRMGFSFEWKMATSDESYTEKEQKIFIKMWNEGQIYSSSGFVNWCPHDNTTLANEQVHDGKCWRCNTEVIQKEIEQYYIKITDYKEKMLEFKNTSKWPEEVIKMQKAWIDRDEWFDWGISRQRYWGTPVPIIRCDSCGKQPVPEDQLPVRFPDDVEITGKGNPMDNHEWVKCKCPVCGGDAQHETDTLDTFMESSWYYYNYFSENNAMIDKDQEQYWMPVDYYIGGIEHATMHMIYARYFSKMMYDNDIISIDQEPWDNVITQGMVNKDGKKMSKSIGNIVEPSTIIDQYGADTARCYTMFASPVTKTIEWSDSSVSGVYKFIKKLYDNRFNFVVNFNDDKNIDVSIYNFIADINNSIPEIYEHTFEFNVLIARCMEIFNKISSQKNDYIWSIGYKTICNAMAPIMPHICSEISTDIFGNDNFSWRKIDKMEQNVYKYVVMYEGKKIKLIEVENNIEEDVIIYASQFIKFPYTNVKFVKNKIVNFHN